MPSAFPAPNILLPILGILYLGTRLWILFLIVKKLSSWPFCISCRIMNAHVHLNFIFLSSSSFHLIWSLCLLELLRNGTGLFIDCPFALLRLILLNICILAHSSVSDDSPEYQKRRRLPTNWQSILGSQQYCPQCNPRQWCIAARTDLPVRRSRRGLGGRHESCWWNCTYGQTKKAYSPGSRRGVSSR